MRGQQIALVMCTLNILCLACAEPLGCAAPRVLASVLAFTLVQLWEVVGGDVRMTDIQADILPKQRGRAVADAFERDVIFPARQATRRLHSYGRVSETGKEQPL